MRMSTRWSALTILALTGCNEPPGSPTVAIEPAEPNTNDVLRVVISSEAVDPNKNDAITYTYRWLLDGEPVADLTGTEVPIERTARGQNWTVEVTPADDKLSGPMASATVTIINSIPTASATITPGSPKSTEDLNLVIQTEDADGDTVNTTISWTVDGAPAGIGTERVPADRTVRGQVWEATVTPRDARDVGEPVKASVTVENQAPVMTSVRLRPDPAYEKSKFEAVVEGTDADGDRLTYTPTWSVNGVEVPEVTGLSLDGKYFDRGDKVSVSVTVSDGVAESAPLSSKEIVVQNTPPVLATATVTPSAAKEADTLSCVTSGWQDDDGDKETVRVQWLRDATVISTADTVNGDDFDKGDRISCRATPWDGIEEGIPAIARPVTIANTPPVAGTVTIGPKDPPSGTTIVPTLSGDYDEDDEPVSLDISWYVNGVQVATGATLSGSAYVRTNTIEARVTPFDGTDYGATVKSNILTAVNAPPKIKSHALTPSKVTNDSTIGMTIVTEDSDRDTVTLKWAWTLNGSPYGSSSTTTIPASATTRGDTFAVTVTPNDGTVDGTAVSVSGSVVNAPPTAPTITVTPKDPKDTDDVLCSITKTSTDEDADPISYTFSWTKNGSTYSGSTLTKTYPGDTVPNTATAIGEVWECTVKASDGRETTSATAKQTIGGDAVTFTFTDTSSDDIKADALVDFFKTRTVLSTEYIFLEIDDGSSSTTTDGAWCSERADWYADNYVTYASGSTTLSSGSWNKWSREIGGSWSGATTTTYSNYFGSGCDGYAYSWCSEWGIGGNSLGIMPNQPSSGESYASGSWSSGRSWKVTVKFGPSRSTVCGF